MLRPGALACDLDRRFAGNSQTLRGEVPEREEADVHAANHMDPKAGAITNLAFPAEHDVVHRLVTSARRPLVELREPTRVSRTAHVILGPRHPRTRGNVGMHESGTITIALGDAAIEKPPTFHKVFGRTGR